MSNTAEVLTDTDQEVIDIDADWEPMLSHGKPSHQLESIRYFSSELLLYVRFPGGSIYRYDNVPPHIVTQLRSADSKGSFFILNIKKAPFPYKKIKDKSQAPPVEIVGQSGVTAEEMPLSSENSKVPEKVEMAALEKEALGIVGLANAIQVRTMQEAKLAMDFVRERKGVIKVFTTWFKEIKDGSWRQHQLNLAKEKGIVDPNEESVRIVMGKVKAFDDEQERLRKAEAERIRLEAEKAERERREKEEADRKERQRLEDEERAKEEARIKAEREKLEADKKAQADALEQAGKAEEAERIRKEQAAKAELQKLMDENRRIKEENERMEAERAAKEALEAPIYVAPVVVEEEKIEGLGKAYPWKGEVTDIRTLCKGIAEGKTPIDVIKINQSKIDGLAKTWKEKTGEHHPGVRGYEDKQLRVG